jgi:hypothetical protein
MGLRHCGHPSAASTSGTVPLGMGLSEPLALAVGGGVGTEGLPPVQATDKKTTVAAMAATLASRGQPTYRYTRLQRR